MQKTPLNVKAQTSPLRYFEDSLFEPHNCALIMLNTTFLNFELAMALNNAYQLQLLRIDDCPVAGGQYPCFIHHDRATLLSFVMLDRPAAQTADPVFDIYDKMLIVRGRNSRPFINQLYDDVTTRLVEPPADELLQHNHWQALCLLGSGIIDAATFTPQPHGQLCATSLHPDASLPMPRRLATYLSRMQQFLTLAFQTFEWHLSNPDELE